MNRRSRYHCRIDSLAYYFLEFAILPGTFDQTAVETLECALPMHSIVAELSLIDLTIREHQNAQTLFAIFLEISLIWYPFFVHGLKVGVVETLPKHGRSIIVHDSLPIKLVIFPLSLVGDLSIWIIECAVAFHFVVFPLSAVSASFLVDELSLAISHAILFVALVSCPDLVLFLHVTVPWIKLLIGSGTLGDWLNRVTYNLILFFGAREGFEFVDQWIRRRVNLAWFYIGGWFFGSLAHLVRGSHLEWLDDGFVEGFLRSKEGWFLWLIWGRLNDNFGLWFCFAVKFGQVHYNFWLHPIQLFLDLRAFNFHVLLLDAKVYLIPFSHSHP